MNKSTSVLLACFLTFAVSLAAAHGPDRGRDHDRSGPRGPEAMEMVGHLHHALKRLDLNETQRAAIRGRFRDMKSEVGPLLEQLREGRADMHAALLAPDYDANAVAAIAEQQGAANAGIIEIVARTVHSALTELTPEQRAELQAMGEHRRNKMAGRLQHLQQRVGAAADDDDPQL